MKPSANDRIFISYSHKKRGPEWKKRLLEQLKPFTSANLIAAWDDEQIPGGYRFEKEIENAIHNARLAVILLTKEALESEFILQRELVPLSHREKEGLIVIPIRCEPCEYKEHLWLSRLQVRPFEAKPLSTLSDPDCDRGLRQLATEIAEELSRVALNSLAPSDGERAGVRGESKTYLDKFPLTRGPGLREEKLIGREQELALLDLALASSFGVPPSGGPGNRVNAGLRTAIVSLVAWGGVGKTMLVQHWLQRLLRSADLRSGANPALAGSETGAPSAPSTINHSLFTRIYAWSFYSQGTKEDRQASEDTFLAHALEWFGVQCEPTLSPWDKGHLLADAVARERTLLILDGIEPLQYPPGPMGGQLRAPGVQSLLKQLARKSSALNSQPSTLNQALCLVTTREPLTDLADFQRREGSAWGSVLRVDLGNLTEEAGAALLHHAGANRAGAAEIKPDDKELLAASREVDGHALTLNLLGRFLARAHGGDIRRRDLVKFEEADRKEQGGTTFKMLAAFESWFGKGGEFGARRLAVLRTLSLFDRPADAGCLVVLRNLPVITGLTEPFFSTKFRLLGWSSGPSPISEEDWNEVVSFLSGFGLLVDQTNADISERLLDCHPLIREHFAKQLREQSAESWRAAHQRLYEHLSNTTEDQPRPTIENLQPLYQAITHGCQAGLYSTAWNEVYTKRVLRAGDRSQDHYSWRMLGAYGTEVVAQASFFVKPWDEPQTPLSDGDKAWLLNEAGFCLRALGRLNEALEPTRASFQMFVSRRAWEPIANGGINLCELELALGNISAASDVIEQTVDVLGGGGESPDSIVRSVFGMQSRADIMRQAWFITSSATQAHSYHEAGRIDDARRVFVRAEARQVRTTPSLTYLVPPQGFMYCNFLLRAAERAAWIRQLDISSGEQGQHGPDSLVKSCQEVQVRAGTYLQMIRPHGALREVGLAHLIIARGAICRGLIESDETEGADFLEAAYHDLEAAITNLRRAAEIEDVVDGLLTCTWLRFLKGSMDGARADLDEAWDIAERGPMRLHLADIHLYRARLFFREKRYPWKSPQADLAAAEKLIHDCGYHRRDEELADAKRAILGS